MNDFHTALACISSSIYEPNKLIVTSIQEEQQNAAYGAGTFELSSKTIRFRVAKVTPTKTGQFVAFWEKDENDKNQPYSYEEALDLLVITTFKNESNFGQFVFSKELLLKHGVLRTNTTNGKMAMRVYPSWDSLTSKQAMKTQEWQLPYFIDMSHVDELTEAKIMKLYGL